MTREQIAGFILGVGVGTAVGFFLRPPEEPGLRQENSEHKRQVSAAGTSVRIRDTGKLLDQRQKARTQFA